MWELKATPRTLRVTNKMAREWAEMDAAHTDRPLSERRLQAYEKMLKAGGFRPVTWARVFCKETNQHYRVNGKHTSTLFSAFDLSTVPEQYVVVEEYECETLEDVAKLYGTFDSRAQVRNANDVTRSFAAVIPEVMPLRVHLVAAAVSGLAWNANPTMPTRESAAERAERLFDNVPFVLWLDDILRTGEAGDPRHLFRAPVAGAMAGCYFKAKGPATEFWSAVRDESGPKATLPDRKLSRYLLTCSVSVAAGTNARPKRLQATQREFYVKCLHAWNAWRRGESTDLKYYADRKLPAIA